MRRRLFFAINFDLKTVAAIRHFSRDIENKFGPETAGSIRFMAEDSWHLTVLFLGEEDDAELTPIMRAAKETVRHFMAPEIFFENIAYAPKKDAPRMVWLKTAPASSRATGELRNFLEEELVREKVPFPSDRRPFSGHVTLARLMDVPGGGGSLPDIARTINIVFPAASLDLMESELGRNGATYTVLQKFPFRGKVDTIETS